MLILEKNPGLSLKDFLSGIFSRCYQGSRETVLIKPNWGGRIPLIKGENTDTLFLKYLTEYLYSKNTKKIYVVHDSLLSIEGQDHSFNKLLDINGIRKVEFPPIVEFLNLDDVERDTLTIDGFQFHLPGILKKVDFYINLAKLKTHMETKISLCLKNQMGLLPSEDKKTMHRNGLEYGIALLAKLVKPDLSIIDGIFAMDKNGPHHGRTKYTNIVICSDDMLQADSLAAYLMDYNPDDIPHLKFAEESGEGITVTEETRKEYSEYRLHDFMQAEECLSKFNLNIWPTNACSQCIFNLENVQKYLKRSPFVLARLMLNKTRTYNIVIGKGRNLTDKLPVNTILIGDCSSELAEGRNIESLEGCPPSSRDIFEFIKKTILSK